MSRIIGISHDIMVIGIIHILQVKIWINIIILGKKN
jgi:hypothetical protein